MSWHELIEEQRSEDPWMILGAAAEAGDEVIREAYLEKRAVVPAEELPQLDRAYRRIRTEPDRVRTRLLGPSIPDHIEELVQEIRPRPRYAGPGAWLTAMDRLRKKRDTKSRNTPESA